MLGLGPLGNDTLRYGSMPLTNDLQSFKIDRRALEPDRHTILRLSYYVISSKICGNTILNAYKTDKIIEIMNEVSPFMGYISDAFFQLFNIDIY